MLKKIIKEIKRAITSVDDKDNEKIIFFSLNLADYQRYLCEVASTEETKNESIIECENSYNKLFTLFDAQFIAKVNPCRVTACYHYSIFLYEICNKKNEAIEKLKQYHQEIIENLDTAYKIYLETYDLLTIITDNLTCWIINRNSIANVESDDIQGDVVY